MSRQFVVCAVLFVAVLAGSAFAPGRLGPAAAAQATPAAATDCPTTTAEENEALVRHYYDEAYNGQDLAVVDELLADDFVRHNVAAPQDNQPGNADDQARVESWLAAFPDLHVAIEDLYASPETVISYVIWSGTQDGPLSAWGAPATGRPMERESLVVWRIACGQLA